MHKQILVLMSLTFLGVVGAMGCTSNAVPVTDGSSEPDVDSPLDDNDKNKYPRFVLKYMLPNGDGLEDSGNSVTTERLKATFEGVDWTDADSKSSLAVELSRDTRLAVRLSATATEDQTEWVAIWTQPGPTLGNTTTAIVRQSKPIVEADETLTLLDAFAKSDPNFESLVEWRDGKSDSED